jgi:hypothetical protein
MDNLKIELERVQHQLEAARQSSDPDAIEKYERRANEIKAQIEAQEAVKAQQQAAVIAEVQDPESSFSITVNGYTVDFREYARDEESYQALTIATRLKFHEIETENQAEQKALKESYEAEKSIAQSKYDSWADELHQLRLERDDFQSRWKNAAVERDTLVTENEAQKAEIESLKRQVEELRATIQKPAVATNLDANALADAIAKANAAKPAVYNMREHNGHYVAFLAETDEEININWLDKGKYRVLSDEEARRFRQEREEAQKAALESVPEVAVEVEPVAPPYIAFREEDPDVQEHSLLRESTTEGLGDVAQVTREEIEARFKRIEDQLGLKTWQYDTEAA